MCIIVKRDCLLTFSAHTSHVRVDAYEKKLWKNVVSGVWMQCSHIICDVLVSDTILYFFIYRCSQAVFLMFCLQLGRNTSLSSLHYSVRVLFTAGQKYVTFFPSVRWSTHAQVVCTPLGTKAVTTVHNFSTSPFCIIVHFILYASSWNSICTQYRFFFLVCEILLFGKFDFIFTCLDDLHVWMICKWIPYSFLSPSPFFALRLVACNLSLLFFFHHHMPSR